jgi:hypothetical protein
VDIFVFQDLIEVVFMVGGIVAEIARVGKTPAAEAVSHSSLELRGANR